MLRNNSPNWICKDTTFFLIGASLPEKNRLAASANGYEKEVAAGGGDPEGMSGATAHNPEYAAGGIDKEQLALFIEKGIFVVGEVVAEELAATFHAKGLEAVALLPVAERKGQGEAVGIEKGLVGGQLAGIGSQRRVGDGLDMKAGKAGGSRGLERSEEKDSTVEESLMGDGEKTAARSGGGKYVGNGGRIEAIGAQQFEEKLKTEGRGVGTGELREGGELEADLDGAVGKGGDKLLLDGLEEVAV